MKNLIFGPYLILLSPSAGQYRLDTLFFADGKIEAVQIT